MTRFNKKQAKQAKLVAAGSEPLGTLNYFPIRGRGEVIRLLLASSERQWDEVVAFNKVEGVIGSADMPFGQCPTWTQSSLSAPLSQMDAICRHIGRQTGLYGRGGEADARIDELLCGIEDLRMQYVKLVYASKFDDEALKQYQASVLDDAGMLTTRCGAHVKFLELFLARHGGEWAVGGKLSIADAAVFDVFTMHVDLCRNAAGSISIKPLEHFPLLAAHFAKFAALPGVASYLASDKRPARVNNCDRW